MRLAKKLPYFVSTVDSSEGLCRRLSTLLTRRNAGTSGEDANVRLKQGFDMISVHTDVGVLASAMINELNTAVGSKADGSSGGGGYS